MTETQTQTYTTINKTLWGPGPWQSEPDKIVWRDEATGLTSMIRRAGSLGHLCGYVAVEPSHPLHGKQDSITQENPDGSTTYLYLELQVHGGITFSGPCDDAQKLWAYHREHLAQAQAEAQKFPLGDGAEFLREWGLLLSNPVAWLDHFYATAICHRAPGDDNLWWFGFDCGHAFDLSPGVEAQMREIHALRGEPARKPIRGSVYRDIAYVQSECTALAQQLMDPKYSVFTPGVTLYKEI